MLTQVAGTQVCPSDDVDQAWHLHITRTVDYERFCRDVLGGFLHHHPADAAPDEIRRHRSMYAATLSHYRRAFGAEAPGNVWPAVDRRFDTAPRRDAPAIELRGGLAIGLVLAFFGLAGVLILALGMNLLGLLAATHAMSGPAFLGIALPVTIALVALGWLSTGPFARADARHTLDAYEAAWLMGDDGRMTATALGLLVAHGCATLRTLVVGTGWRRKSIAQLVVTAEAALQHATLHPAEAACLGAARDGLLDFERAHRAMRPVALRIRRRLRAAGLAADETRIAPARAAMAGVTATWLVVAVERLLHAIGSPRPVGFLVMLTLVGVGLFLALTSRLGRPNWRGRSVLRALRDRLEHQRERSAWRARDVDARPAIDARLLPMTLALLGPAAVLADPAFAGFDDALGPDGMRQASLHVPRNSDGGGGGGGCGGGGCGGGCGG